MAENTKKPTGISIVRDGTLKFVVSWKIGDKDYGAGHQLRWRAWKNDDKWHTAWTNVKMGNTTTTKTITLTASDWYPTAKKPKLYYFEVEIRGKRNDTTVDGKTTTYDWSGWADKKWKMYTPPKPTITENQTAANATTFSWSAETSTKDAHPFTQYSYQTMLVKACSEKDGKNLTWKSSAAVSNTWQEGTGSSTSKTESNISSDSYTRWVRVKSVGPRGDSDWVYKKHVYAKPKMATIKKAKSSAQGSNRNVYLKWVASSSQSHPIDEVNVEYKIAQPQTGMVAPSGDGTVGATLKDSKGKGVPDSVTFPITGATIDIDKCLFVRVITRHDTSVTPVSQKATDWVIPSGGYGKLTAPSNLEVSYDTANAEVTVTRLNTTNSPVADSQIAIVYSNGKKKTVVAVVNRGASTLPRNVKCPTGCDTPKFGAYAFVGTATAKQDANGVNVYAITAKMKSDTFWLAGSGNIPAIPEGFTAEPSGRQGEALLTWQWSWESANKAELSWSTNEYAWESTEEPSTYIVDNTHAAQWRVSGLETGQTYYFRIRLLQETEETIVYGDYTEVQSVNFTSAPVKPVLSLSAGVIASGGDLTAVWGYVTTDGTEQATAEVYTATVNDSAGTVTIGSKVGEATTAQYADIDTSSWTTGQTYNLCVRVTSESGQQSEWSDPIPVYVAAPLTITLSQHSFTSETVDGKAVYSMKSLPFTLTVTGAGAGGTTKVLIERAEDYHIERPDDSFRDGFAGETIYTFSQLGEGQISISKDDIVGSLDDGASYKLYASVEDGYGQKKELEPMDFEVHWTNQAVVPSASVEIDGNIAKITPTAGSGTPSGSTCDIYRLSAGAPQLVVPGGSFGTVYVDPFPAIGEPGGYRVVCVTPNGDYTAGQYLAMYDVKRGIDEYGVIIDFSGERVFLPYDITMSNKWAKDFKLTTYLGGSKRGDWNPAVKRTANYTVNLLSDDENVPLMRKLETYDGVCHVRTPDGFSYAADVQVTEGKNYKNWDVASFTLTITEVDPEAFDGMSLAEWNNQ